MSNLYLALVHYPVLNKSGETVLTSVTNLDIHDIARSASTYGVNKYFIITPDEAQQDFIRRMLSFWHTDAGILYNPDRNTALQTIEITDSIDTCKTWITTQEGMQPVLISTTARKMNNQITFEMIRNLRNDTRPVLLIFGTGYGLTESVHDCCDFILQPIEGVGDYNHLSVRSAAAIVLDRIASRCI